MQMIDQMLVRIGSWHPRVFPPYTPVHVGGESGRIDVGTIGAGRNDSHSVGQLEKTEAVLDITMPDLFGRAREPETAIGCGFDYLRPVTGWERDIGDLTQRRQLPEA